MQLITQDQIHYIELAGQVVTIITVIVGFIRSIIKKLDDKLHEVITINSNRVRDELQSHFDSKRSELYSYIDQKFIEHETHEDCALEKITAIELQLKDISSKIK